MTIRTPLYALLAAFAVTACGDATDTPAPIGGDAIAAEEVAAPEIHNSSLNAGDDTLESGEYLESYDIVVREGQWLRVEVVSGDFDPYLLILSPTGEQTDVDDSAAGNTSMTKAVVQATEGGEWQVVVTSYAVGESGAYELSMQVMDERPDDAQEGQQITPDDIDPDAEATGDTLDA